MSPTCILQQGLSQQTLDRIVLSIKAAVPDVEKIYLFGSFARQDNKPDSDIDLYIISPSAVDWRCESESVICATLQLMWLQKSKDLIVATQERFTERSELFGSLESVVVNEGVLIYG
jgi:predicted nucleotidyltransferase